METLEDFNKRQYTNSFLRTSISPVKNGIYCKCGAELLDTYPGSILLSYPPKKNVHCDICGFTGYRIA